RSLGSRRLGIPSGASKRLPQSRQDQSAASAPAHAGQASSSRNSSTSEDRVNERSQRLDSRGQNQHQPKDAEKDGQRHEPALTRVASPQAAREIRNRSARAPEHDQPASHPATFRDHVSPSFTGSAG